jgi:hypothetical protein
LPTSLALFINPESFAVSVSKGWGQIIKKANTSSNTMAALRITFCERPKCVTSAESNRLAAAKLITKPATINKGRRLLF